jgi:hypothetical protein
MKTLFALVSGAVLGTIAALWLAARRDAGGSEAPNSMAPQAAPRPTPPQSLPASEPVSEEASA